jgi:hypothetical protein
MAILLCGITMSHYAHFNLSPMGQIAVQHVFRVLALVAGKTTCYTLLHYILYCISYRKVWKVIKKLCFLNLKKNIFINFRNNGIFVLGNGCIEWISSI